MHQHQSLMMPADGPDMELVSQATECRGGEFVAGSQEVASIRHTGTTLAL